MLSLDITWFLLNRQAKVDSCIWIFLFTLRSLFCLQIYHVSEDALRLERGREKNSHVKLFRVFAEKWLFLSPWSDLSTSLILPQNKTLIWHSFTDTITLVNHIHNQALNSKLLFLPLTRNACELCFWTWAIDFQSSLASQQHKLTH